VIRKFAEKELVIATHNRGKMKEFQSMFGREHKTPDLTFYTAEDFGLPSPAETGTTFIENGTIKALFAAQGSGKVALADDSGFCIEALGGDPSVYAADWAEKPDGTRDFGWAMQKVLQKMGDTANRKAYFVSVLVLAWPDGHIETVEGRAHGRIIDTPLGAGGHGYDPIFVPEGYDMTYAEMEESVKNAISHRSKAFHQLMEKCF